MFDPPDPIPSGGCDSPGTCWFRRHRNRPAEMPRGSCAAPKAALCKEHPCSLHSAPRRSHLPSATAPEGWYPWHRRIRVRARRAHRDTPRSCNHPTALQAHRLSHELADHFVSMKTRHEQHPLYQRLHLAKKLVCVAQPDFEAALTRFLHAAQERLWDHHSVQLVVTELRVLVTLQRHDFHNDGDRRIGDAIEKSVQLLEVVQGLGDGDIGPGFHFPMEPFELQAEIRGHWIEGAGDEELRRSANGVAGPVHALVELLDDLDESDGVHVPNTSCLGLDAGARRITGQRDDVSNSQRMRTKQIRLKRHRVSVASREMDEGLESNLLLDKCRECDAVHPHTCHRAVADVDAVGTGLLYKP